MSNKRKAPRENTLISDFFKPTPSQFLSELQQNEGKEITSTVHDNDDVCVIDKTPVKQKKKARKSNLRPEEWGFDEKREQSLPESPECKSRSENRNKFLRKFGQKREVALTEDDGEEGVNDEKSDDRMFVPDEAVHLLQSFSNEDEKNVGVGKKATAAVKKLTPLQTQYMKLREQYPGVLLIIEVGYKFRFFEEDAKVASKVLGIAHFLDHELYTASIPVHRLDVHVKRLVYAGHKVGVIRQTETAALKAVGDNRNAPFQRKLTALYTQGTMVDNFNLDDDDLLSAPSTGYILCISEREQDMSPKTNISIVAAQPNNGSIMYDTFLDGQFREELETRLLHLDPCEILICGHLSNLSSKIVKAFTGRITSRPVAVRVEYLSVSESKVARENVETFFDSADTRRNENYSKSDVIAFLDDLESRSFHLIISLDCLISYLKQYGLHYVLRPIKQYEEFSTRGHMILNGNAINSLDLYKNQADSSEKGSLLWVINHTKTKFGRRLLRNWLGRPLLDQRQLLRRSEAVEEIFLTNSSKISDVTKLLRKLPDLEKGLCRIYYGRCQRPELLNLLQILLQVSSTFPSFDRPSTVGFKSEIINEAIATLPICIIPIVGFLDTFNHQYAAKDDKYNMFQDDEKYSKINRRKAEIKDVETRLKQHLDVARRESGINSLNYVTVAGVEYLLEVRNKDVKKIPPSWIKVSGTKAFARFHSPQIIAMISEKERYKELLAIACDDAYSELLQNISIHYDSLRNVIRSLAVLDCVISLSVLAALPGYVRPSFVSDQIIDLQNARHPIIEQYSVAPYVANGVNLQQKAGRALVITGPNMGGKSCYVRQVALLVLMAQIGSFIPCDKAILGIFDGIYTRMGAFDNIVRGESTFMVEMHETAEIMRQATSRSLVLLDEIGRGTSTFDGFAIAQAVLEYFLTVTKSITLFITHYPQILNTITKYPELLNASYMNFKEHANADGSHEVTFLYTLVQGIAPRSYGLNVARLAGIENSIIQGATVKSKAFEEESLERDTLHCLSAVENILGPEADWKQLQMLLDHA